MDASSLSNGMGVENELHVLAVDDSLIDRRLVEKLLKNSSFKGNTTISLFLGLFYRWVFCSAIFNQCSWIYFL